MWVFVYLKTDTRSKKVADCKEQNNYNDCPELYVKIKNIIKKEPTKTMELATTREESKAKSNWGISSVPALVQFSVDAKSIINVHYEDEIFASTDWVDADFD